MNVLKNLNYKISISKAAITISCKKVDPKDISRIKSFFEDQGYNIVAIAVKPSMGC